MSSNATSGDARKGVDLLKELLFDNEAEALAGLDQRLKSIEEQNEAGTRERLDTARRIEQLFERAGTEDRFRSSVAVVLDKALRDAELRNHDELSHALAPLVVNTIKTELKNSQDEMVDILYPLTGRMVQAYVKSAIKDLTEQINNRIDQNPVMLRMRSMMSGKSVAELAIAESQRLEVEEVFLIRRGSGELVARWPEAARTSNTDIHMSGVLAAINEFASTAFEQDGGHFRSFEFENIQVFLRASPAYVLAARCQGIPPSGIEEIFDEEFLSTLERIARVEQAAADEDAGAEGHVRASELAPLAQSVGSRTTAIYEETANSGFGGALLKALLFLIAVPLLAWFFWGLYTDAEEMLVRRAAKTVLQDTTELAGYPTTLEVGYRGKTLTLSGLAPDSGTQRRVNDALRQELPGTRIQSKLAVIPTTDVDLRPVEQRMANRLTSLERAMTSAAILRALTRAETRLAETRTTLERLNAGPGLKPGEVAATREAVTKVLSDVETLREGVATPGDGPSDLQRFVEPLNVTSERIAGLYRGLAEPGASAPARPGASRAPDTLSGAADQLSSEAERLATMVSALSKAVRLIPPPLPPQRIVEAPKVTPEEHLRRFATRQAIFFSSGTEFTTPQVTDATLDEAARLIKAAGNVVVRVVGYTDSQGGAQQNSPLAASRADKVADELVARGVPRDRLVAVGRINGYFEITPSVGENSLNRRVEFEVGFMREGRQSP